jgi:hypothetical protein
MAKKNINNSRYEKVDKLPKNALTVSEYAKQRDTSTNYLYNLIRDNKNKDFKIVVFNTINFVIPA